MPRARPKILTSTPFFNVAGLQRSLDFYARLAFGTPAIWGDPPCFAMIHRDAFELMLSLAEKPAHIRPNGPNGQWDVYFRISDLAAEQAALTAAGVPLARKPEKTVYDMLEMEVLDPDGYRVCFGQSTG